MQVLHIIKATGLAGAENHLMTLLPGLRDRGIDARLWLWVPPDLLADNVMIAAQERGIPIERSIMPRAIAPGFFVDVIRYLRRQRPNIVHTHLIHAETYGIPAAKIAGVHGIVNSCHNDDPFRFTLPLRWRSWILWKIASRGIAISNALRDFLIEIEHAPPQKIQTVYYGLQAPPLISPDQWTLRQELNLPPHSRLIGSMCRLIEQKGLPYALEATAPLCSRYSDLHYVIVGEGKLKNDLIEQAKKLDIADRVHFIGWRTDVQALMAQFEMFIAPSLWEGFGLVFLEAMGQARPIITTCVSSIPEVVHDQECGILVPPRDSQALSDAIAYLLDHPTKAKAMGEAGRNRLETVFDPQHMIDQTAAIYQDLIKM